MPALTPLNEGSETLTVQDELVWAYHLGFYPGTSLYEAPYPFPGATSYPGATHGNRLLPLTEGTETLTVMTEA